MSEVALEKREREEVEKGKGNEWRTGRDSRVSEISHWFRLDVDVYMLAMIPFHSF